jgi:hypothetical protein
MFFPTVDVSHLRERESVLQSAFLPQLEEAVWGLSM